MKIPVSGPIATETHYTRRNKNKCTAESLMLGTTAAAAAVSVMTKADRNQNLCGARARLEAVGEVSRGMGEAGRT